MAKQTSAKLDSRVFGYDFNTMDAVKYGNLKNADFSKLSAQIIIASMDASAREANAAIKKVMESAKCK